MDKKLKPTTKEQSCQARIETKVHFDADITKKEFEKEKDKIISQYQ